MQIVDELPSGHDQRQMLHDKVDSSVAHVSTSDPHGGILGDRELTRKDGELNLLQLMWAAPMATMLARSEG